MHSLGWRVCLDIATWCTLDDVRRLALAVDWWQPWERRLEAWREGAEDFHWLKVAEKLGAAEEFRSAERLRALDATSDPAAVKAWRDGLLRGIAAPR